MRRWGCRLVAAVLLGLVLVVGSPVAAGAADCKPHGVPDVAGSGVPGQVDMPLRHPSGDTKYGEYGWAGLKWNTCDLGFGPDAAADPIATVDTYIGNKLMGGATVLASLMTQLHAWAADPGTLLSPVDKAVAKVTDVTRRALWNDWAPVFIVVAGALVIMQASRGDARRALRTMAAVVLAAGVVAWIAAGPVQLARTFDGIASQIVGNVDRSIVTEHRSAMSDKEARGATFQDNVLFPLWCRGEVGSSAGAQKYCERLYKAGTVKYATASDYSAGDRRNQYNSIAQQMKDDDHGYYDTLRGKDDNRTGQGFLAFVMMLIIAIIRIPAEVLMLAGLLVVRLVIMFGPLFALAGILEFSRPLAVAAMKMTLASVVNVAIFGVIAAVHTAVVAGIITSGLGIFSSLFLIAALTFVIWMISKPFRSPTRLATGEAAAESLAGSGDSPSRALSKFAGLVGTGTATFLGARAGTEAGLDRQDATTKPDVVGSDDYSRVREPTYVVHQEFNESPRPAALRDVESFSPELAALPASRPAAISGADDPAMLSTTRADHRAPPSRAVPSSTGPSHDPNESLHVVVDVAIEHDLKHIETGTAPVDDEHRTEVLRLIEPEYDRNGEVTYEIFRPSVPRTAEPVRTGVR
jgi:hypothetical protein